MKGPTLYLWSVLQTVEDVDESELYHISGRAAGDLPIADPQLRVSDILAAVGAWAERTDLPDSATYISNLRGGGAVFRIRPDPTHGTASMRSCVAARICVFDDNLPEWRRAHRDQSF